MFEVRLPLEKNNIWLKKFNLMQENRNDSPATWSHMDVLVWQTHLNRVFTRCVSVRHVLAIDWVQDPIISVQLAALRI